MLDVFVKFKDEEGSFASNNTRGLLSFTMMRILGRLER